MRVCQGLNTEEIERLVQRNPQPSRRHSDVRPVEPVELADELGRTAKLLGGRLTDRLSGHGLSMPRFQMLVALARNGPLRLTQLSARVGVSQGTASTLAEALVQDGLVERSTDPRDGRATQLAVTDEGRRRAQAWHDDYQRAAEEIFGGLPADQRSVLLASLRALTAKHGISDED